MGKGEFAAWLEGKFLSWMGETGQRRTLTEFAKYLGVSQSLLSQWLNGRYIPDRENLGKLARCLGPEVYEMVGMLRPDPDAQRLMGIFGELDEKGKKDLLQCAEQIRGQKKRQG